tara:strand:+ start:155 stop:763 length:609 start_codon:yes stop_codon:yes gene_type:complete
MPDSKHRIVAHYEKLYRQHGNSPLASDYGSRESQNTKFRVLSEAVDYSGKSILDIGCGFASFSSYLEEHFKGVQYHGVDIAPSVIKEANKQFPQHRIECRDILKHPPDRRYDIVTANGIFYLVQDEPEEFMRRMIAAMYSFCDEAVAFNTLSVWADYINENEFYADPSRIVDFCRSLTTRIILRHDYMAHDFTVYLYREEAG